MKLNDIFENVFVGITLSKVNSSDESSVKYRLLTTRAMRNNKIIDDNLDLFYGGCVEEKYLTKVDDVIIKSSAPYDAVVIDGDHQNLLIPSFCITLRGIKDIDPILVSIILNSDVFKKRIRDEVLGGGVLMLSKIRLFNIDFINFEDKELIETITQYGKELLRKKSLFSEIIALEEERLSCLIGKMYEE
ncbi:MAG: hypothetical protein WBO70_00630 [Erysipelotrichaceae bacterium]